MYRLREQTPEALRNREIYHFPSSELAAELRFCNEIFSEIYLHAMPLVCTIEADVSFEVKLTRCLMRASLPLKLI